MLAKHHLRDRFEALNGAPLVGATASLLEKNFVPTGTVLVRRDALRAVGGFNQALRYGEDLELWVKIAARFPITCLARVHMLRRRHSDNATENALPMLEGLVDVSRSIRDWDAETLRSQGTDPDRLVADSLWQLAYWHFNARKFRTARNFFATSLREKSSARALGYWLACSLPASCIDKGRRFKQFFGGPEVSR